MEYTTLLLELDSILDTRLSLLINTFKDRIDDILPIYFNRKTNEFKDIISLKDFNDLYKNRDRSVLKDAVICKSLLLVKDFVSVSLDNMIQTGLDIPPKLILNLYPYDLSSDEIKTIITSIIFHVGTEVDIEVAYLKHTDIEPIKLNKTIWGYLKFDYYNWLEDNGELFKDPNQRCPDTKLITPAYFPVSNKDLNSLFIENGKKVDPYFYFKAGLSYIIDIEFTEKSMFNRMVYVDKPEIKTPESS
jgi:hypothetical protein